jgi:lipopolysaccharide export system permease protein
MFSYLFIYITKHFFKFFFIIFIALILFFVGFDYLNSADKIPKSANLKILYIIYRSFYITDLIFPLALVMGFILTMMQFIKSNTLIAFYSLGFSKRDVVKPIISSALLLTILFIIAHTTKFVYGKEYSDTIINKKSYVNNTMNLFFKYEHNGDMYYIYFKNLYPLKEKVNGIRIFKIVNNDLKEVLSAKKASYKDSMWNIENAEFVSKPLDIKIDSDGITFTKEALVKTLEGFRPKILDQVSEGEASFTLIDAIDAFVLLKNQDLNLNRIKSILYTGIVFPFFALFLIIIFFSVSPDNSRYANLGLYSFGGLLMTLLTWGSLFASTKLATNGTMNPELAIVFPMFLLFVIAQSLYIKKIR